MVYRDPILTPRRIAWPELREWRRRHDLSATEAGIILGVCPPYISQLETGTRQPSETLRRLLEVFELHPEAVAAFRPG